jgi:hypothetical protein
MNFNNIYFYYNKIETKIIYIITTIKIYIMEDCPICYESITNINVCVTICNHKFHTSCLLTNSLKCENICPICRTNLSPNVSKSIIPPGTYTASEINQYMEQNNISIADTSSTIRSWLEECKEYEEILQQRIETDIQMEKKQKNDLKKNNANKYELFYGKK